MPTNTYTALATITLGSSTAAVTFGSIGSGYRDLVLVVSGTANALEALILRFNGDSGSNYSYVMAFGNGSTTSSAAASSQTSTLQNYMNTTQTNNIIHIMDYSATDKHKTILSRYNSANASLQMAAERWANTSAITSIYCGMKTGTMSSGTTLSLYGIAS